MNNDTLDTWFEKSEETPEVTPGVAQTLYDEAWSLYDKGKFKEALVLINVAIDHNSEEYTYFNTRGLILHRMSRYSESKKAFDDALNLKNSDEVLLNKAQMMYDWANSLNDKPKALEIITEAIEITDNLPDVDQFKYWYMKGSILDCLTRPIEARKCYLMAEGMVDEVKLLDEQLDIITNSKDILINITGLQFYYGLEPFRPGVTVDLIPESDNEHDPDAIRVEIEGETVGYVANSDYTLMEGIKSATDIRDMKFDKAEILFIYSHSI